MANAELTVSRLSPAFVAQFGAKSAMAELLGY